MNATDLSAIKQLVVSALKEQQASQSSEMWLLGAVALMLIFNIIWKVIEKRLFPDEEAKQVLANLISLNKKVDSIAALVEANNELLIKASASLIVVQKLAQDTFDMHDDRDDNTGQLRWKIPYQMTEMMAEQLKILRDLLTTNATMGVHMENFGSKIGDLSTAINTMVRTTKDRTS